MSRGGCFVAGYLRGFAIIGTGHDVPSGAEYVGTAHVGPFVWHVFERFDAP